MLLWRHRTSHCQKEGFFCLFVFIVVLFFAWSTSDECQIMPPDSCLCFSLCLYAHRAQSKQHEVGMSLNVTRRLGADDLTWLHIRISWIRNSINGKRGGDWYSIAINRDHINSVLHTLTNSPWMQTQWGIPVNTITSLDAIYSICLTFFLCIFTFHLRELL